MCSSGEIVIQPDSEGLYVKVVTSWPSGSWVVILMFGILLCAVVGHSMIQGDPSHLLIIPVMAFVLFCWVSGVLSKKELWLSKNGIRYRDKHGVMFPRETTMLALKFPRVKWHSGLSSLGGSSLEMSYPHSGQTVEFFAYQGLSQEKAQEICDAVEAYISKISTAE